jgi:hypothetical protein
MYLSEIVFKLPRLSALFPDMPRFIQYLLSRNLQGKELTDEKIRDFKRIVIAQSAIIFSLFLLALFEQWGFKYHIEIAETIFFSFLGVYTFFLWDALRNYTTNRRIIIVNFVFINGAFLIATLGTNPWIPMEPTLTYRIFLIVVMICLLGVESSVIYFTILEFFKKDLGLGIKLWGAAALYLMTGLSFACIYEIFCIFQVDCLGTEFPLHAVAFMKRIDYSLMILSGMDTPFTPNGVLYALGMIEALWGQIFIVLIVGRLLVK